MAVVSASPHRGATPVRSTTSARIRRRRGIRPPEISADRAREQRHHVERDHDDRVQGHIARVAHGRHGAQGFEREPRRRNDRAMVEARCFCPFCGNEAAEADTDDGRGETRDGSEERAPEERDDDGDSESREDRAPTEVWQRATFDGDERKSGVRSVMSRKRNRSARPTRIGGFAKGAVSTTRRDSVAGSLSASSPSWPSSSSLA